MQYLGKWTYEFLTLGEPISDELNTKILIEYLRGIEDDEGWALINYPNTYKQMAMLEKALTGREVPPDPKIINFADVNIEDIDLPSARIVLEGDEDTFAIYRRVRSFNVRIKTIVFDIINNINKQIKRIILYNYVQKNI